MPRVSRLREVSVEEAEQICKLAASWKQPLHLVKRAKVIQCLLDSPGYRAIKLASSRIGAIWMK